MKIFGVCGDPVFHSRSPQIFNAAFKALSLEAKYLFFAAFSAEEALLTAKEIGFSGLNITSPFKEGVVPFLDIKDETVKRLSAANTVLFSEEGIKAFNTDVDGVRDALSKNGVDFQGRKVAVFGAGGAGKAALLALSSRADLFLFNRTFEKAKKLGEEFGAKVESVKNLERLKEVEIIVFCLSCDERPPVLPFLKKGQVLLDANYSKKNPLLFEAQKKGLRIIDGKEWLFFQALKAFEHFTGLSGPKEVMREALEKEREKRSIIVLAGFMGVGKTEVGKILSRLLDLPFFDLDEEIEKRRGKSIENIFKDEGEEVFRRLEEEEVERIKEIKRGVISLGGGACLSEKNRKILEEHAVVIWLWAKSETILSRVKEDRKRPLLLKDKEKTIKEMLPFRIPFYAKASDILINTEGKDAETIAMRIKKELEYGG